MGGPVLVRRLHRPFDGPDQEHLSMVERTIVGRAKRTHGARCARRGGSGPDAARGSGRL